jgi:hypothetical protein
VRAPPIELLPVKVSNPVLEIKSGPPLAVVTAPVNSKAAPVKEIPATSVVEIASLKVVFTDPAVWITAAAATAPATVRLAADVIVSVERAVAPIAVPTAPSINIFLFPAIRLTFCAPSMSK